MFLPAYIGPGAGFAFVGSFLGLVVSFAMTAVSFLLWPFRAARGFLRRRKFGQRAKIQRLIFLGLDGIDPQLAERFLAEGRLPNLARLKAEGCFHRLRTTFPPISPVAWSTFATGVSPAKHNIFDFLNRSLKSYAPELSSSKVRPPRRVLSIGKLRIPLSRPSVQMRRKSRPFWKILGERAIASTILRVPITFPPEPFHGRLLSAMSTPDLLGTQGSFSQFSTRSERPAYESGARYSLERDGDYLSGFLRGPQNTLKAGGGTLTLPFRIKAAEPIELEISGQRYRLKAGQYSDWIRLVFHAAPGFRVRGLARFLVTETEPEFSLYVTPIQIDPEAPALPISHPPYYAAYLAKLLGPYATAGMAEDTWALNERVIDEAAFLDQAYLTLAEREAMFRNALERTRQGVVACVFDTSDRVQHMFFRHLEGDGDAHWRNTIPQLYERLDRLVGDTMKYVDEKTILFVLSDHGFCRFHRAVNLNSWLHQNGYLALADGAVQSGRYFEHVDWSRTRAYGLGLGGLYLNLAGREAQGIVSAGAQAQELKRELIAKLSGLADGDGQAAILHVYATDALYRGPYLDAAPDLMVGYNRGYRVSWESAIGQVTSRVFEDNVKAWSGDHAVDPALVPGVLFSNRPIDCDDPGLEDLAPTALELFGLDLPSWMDGKPLFRET
jgi:predicted AlkP superfamily phosphohydrolase/phosphomutase